MEIDEPEDLHPIDQISEIPEDNPDYSSQKYSLAQEYHTIR